MIKCISKHILVQTQSTCVKKAISNTFRNNCFSYFTQKCFPKDKLKHFFFDILEFFQKNLLKSSGYHKKDDIVNARKQML